CPPEIASKLELPVIVSVPFRPYAMLTPVPSNNELLPVSPTSIAEGRCTKRLDEIAALAGASRSTARNSIKEAVHYGILERRERRFATAVSAPNILTARSTNFRNGPKW